MIHAVSEREQMELSNLPKSTQMAIAIGRNLLVVPEPYCVEIDLARMKMAFDDVTHHESRDGIFWVILTDKTRQGYPLTEIREIVVKPKQEETPKS